MQHILTRGPEKRNTVNNNHKITIIIRLRLLPKGYIKRNVLG